MTIRKAALAGSWYPASAEQCRQSITEFQAQIDISDLADAPTMGGIAPHAGWFFSGGIACNVVRCLLKPPVPDIMVVFGLHLPPGAPSSIMTDGAWETPLGRMDIDDGFAAELTKRHEFGGEGERFFAGDNTIEVQLPFIKYFSGHTRLVPIGVPPTAEAIEIGQAVAQITADLKASVKVLGSTDLTHYGINYGFMPAGSGEKALAWVTDENDAKVIAAMRDMAAEKVLSEAAAHHNACCSGAVAAAISAGKKMGAGRGQSLAYSTSHAKMPGESFVGYVGLVF